MAFSVSQIRAAVTASGSKFFDKDTLKHFGENYKKDYGVQTVDGTTYLIRRPTNTRYRFNPDKNVLVHAGKAA